MTKQAIRAQVLAQLALCPGEDRLGRGGRDGQRQPGNGLRQRRGPGLGGGAPARRLRRPGRKPPPSGAAGTSGWCRAARRRRSRACPLPTPSFSAAQGESWGPIFGRGLGREPRRPGLSDRHRAGNAGRRAGSLRRPGTEGGCRPDRGRPCRGPRPPAPAAGRETRCLSSQQRRRYEPASNHGGGPGVGQRQDHGGLRPADRSAPPWAGPLRLQVRARLHRPHVPPGRAGGGQLQPGFVFDPACPAAAALCPTSGGGTGQPL